MRKRAADRLAAAEKVKLAAEMKAMAESLKAKEMQVPEKATTQKPVKDQTNANQPTPKADAMRKRAAERLAKEQKLQAEKEAAEANEKAKNAAMKPAAAVEQKKTTAKTSSNDSKPTPIVDEMRRRAADRIAKE